MGTYSSDGWKRPQFQTKTLACNKKLLKPENLSFWSSGPHTVQLYYLFWHNSHKRLLSWGIIWLNAVLGKPPRNQFLKPWCQTCETVFKMIRVELVWFTHTAVESVIWSLTRDVLIYYQPVKEQTAVFLQHRRRKCFRDTSRGWGSGKQWGLVSRQPLSLLSTSTGRGCFLAVKTSRRHFPQFHSEIHHVVSIY